MQREAGARDVLLRGNRGHLVPEAATHATCQQEFTAISESLINHQHPLSALINHRDKSTLYVDYTVLVCNITNRWLFD